MELGRAWEGIAEESYSQTGGTGGCLGLKAITALSTILKDKVPYQPVYKSVSIRIDPY